MPPRNLQQCVADLEQGGKLVRLADEVDARLEAAEIHRRVCAAGGPAILFENVKGCQFPMLSNVLGTWERCEYVFRDTLEKVRRLIELRLEPAEALRHPGRYVSAGGSALAMRPKLVRHGPILDHETRIADLPQLVSWPNDGGPFVTLPVVYTEDAARPGLAGSNIGMYRIQLGGGRYQTNREIGLHYQIHRGIGVHHAAALKAGVPFRVNILVGGSPAMWLAAVMPLPEGMSELGLAGALAGGRIPMVRRPGELPIYAEADFCISGVVENGRLLPEGPFGDHLGYYSLAHDFPVLKVQRVFHRTGAIWPFTVVGRPPQEDTIYGRLIHELTGPIIPTVLPGIRGVNAVDAAGVHPLMLAIGSERYTPYEQRTQPRELLTQANAILGQGQMSLAKYLLIVAGDDDPALDVNDIPAYFAHLLRRIDPARDLHFHTCTTIDTLDYSGSGLNTGSKVVLAAAGPPRRELPTEVPADLHLPAGFAEPRVCLPGVLAVTGPKYIVDDNGANADIGRFCNTFSAGSSLSKFPLVVLVDDCEFTAATLNNFLWVTFTRSNPAADIAGIESFTHEKHWGCRGSIVIDARTKSHHAPPLEPDPEITARVDALAARGGPLAKWL